jgi:methylated-DNA-protein-cysteine methyltransferase-like protein
MIPEGKVASYGQVAKLAGLPGYARYVGAVLAHLPKATKLPWHRVVNASLNISDRPGDSPARQREKLESEGVVFIGQRIAKSHRWDTE